MATHYFTAKYADPLVVLPRMGLFYLNSTVCFLTPFGRGLKRMLDNCITAGGDFRIEMTESGMVALRIQYAELDFSCSLSGCCAFVASVVCVQRQVRQRQGRLRVVAEFQRSNWGASLPVDIVKKITHVCFESRLKSRQAVILVYTDSCKTDAQSNVYIT
jgi:hypothetical protein